MTRGHPASHRPNERGIALILVLVLLPLVAILMTQLNFETAIGDRLASNLLANRQFQAAIQARIAQMRLRLVRDLKNDDAAAKDQGAYDAYDDIWGPDSMGGGTAESVKKGDKENGDEITLQTEVFDEQGKFNLNLLLANDPKRAGRAYQTFIHLLDLFRDSSYGDLKRNNWDLSAQEAAEVADAVRKFLQGETRDSRLPKPSIPDPSPAMKQGIYTVRDLVFAHPLFRERRLLETFQDVDSDQTIPSLTEFVTIYGDGKVNANTAPIQLLRAMFEDEKGRSVVAPNILHARGGFLNTPEDQQQQQEAQKQREQDAQNGTQSSDQQQTAAFTSPNAIAKVDGMGDAAYLRSNEIDIGRDFTVRSNVFTVIVTASRDNFLCQQRVVFQRNTAGCQVLETEIVPAEEIQIPHVPSAAPPSQ